MVLSSILSISLLSIGLIFTSHNQLETTANENGHDSSCNWNHYLSLEPSLDNNGNKEYYICCNHNTYTFDRPAIGNISEPKYLSADFLNSLDNNDERVVLSYSKQGEILNNKIESIYNHKENLSFIDFISLNEYNHDYQNLDDSFKYLISNHAYLVYLNSRFNSRYSRLLDVNDMHFANQEYSVTRINEITYGNETGVKEYISLSNITGNDTFWIHLNSNFDITSFSSINFYVKSSKDYTLQYRMQKNYIATSQYQIRKDEWNLVSIDTSSISTLSDLGLAIWFGTPNFEITDLTFTCFYGEKKVIEEDPILFNSSIDSLIYNDYVCSFSSRVVKDENNRDVYELYDLSTPKDWLWFKPNLSLSISSYEVIYFYMKTSVDTSIEIRETYTGLANLISKIQLKANEWKEIVLPVNENIFPSLNLNNLGIGKYKEGGHDVISSGVWSFSSIYGINKSQVDGYELIDGKYVPNMKIEDKFDITAYAVPQINESNADLILSDVKNAGFSKIIPLYNGRNGTLENQFAIDLKNYNNALVSSKKKEYKAKLEFTIDAYMDNIKPNNKLILSKSSQYNLKVVDFISIIYDLSSLCSNQNFTLKDSIYKEVMEYILSKLDYSSLYSSYDGLFLKDEPGVKENMANYAVFNGLYLNTYKIKGKPFINLLPFGDGGNFNNYNTYLNNYFSKLFPSLGYASFDQYPVKANGSIITNHLYNLSLYANRIKECGARELKTFIHSTNMDDATYDISGISSSEEILFQMYSNMAFGSNDIAYFLYSSNSNLDNGLVNFTTYSKTNLYGYSKTANEEINSFSPYYSYFDYSGIYAKGNLAQFNKLDNKLNSLNKMSFSSSFDSLLVSEYKNNNDYSYLLMNYSSPRINNEIKNATIRFNDGINYALVFENGTKHLRKVVDSTLSFSISPGKGIYLIPLSL